MDGQQKPKRARRERLYEIIFEADTPSGKAFDVGLIIAIVVSVIVVVLSTLRVAQEEPLRLWFYGAEWCFTALFTAEYLLRLSVTRRPLRYAFSFFGIIDLLSILPAFVGLVMPGGERLMVVRTLRLLRIFRVFKLTRYLSEAQALRRAFYLSRHKIAVFLATVLIVVLITSALMHVVEGSSDGMENGPFDSLPRAMYWTVITMTTVGYGDITPQTVLGKFITTLLVLVGYSLIIVPTGILSAEIQTASKKQKITTQVCHSCMREGHETDAAYCKFCGEKL